MHVQRVSLFHALLQLGFAGGNARQEQAWDMGVEDFALIRVPSKYDPEPVWQNQGGCRIRFFT